MTFVGCLVTSHSHIGLDGAGELANFLGTVLEFEIVILKLTIFFLLTWRGQTFDFLNIICFVGALDLSVPAMNENRLCICMGWLS
jgi:hypothetical protein